MNKVHALTAFKPFFRLLTAFDSRNFVKIGWLRWVQNICFAFGVTVLITFLPTSIVLVIWALIDKNDALQNVVVAAPLLITILQLFIKIVILTNKHGEVSATLEQLQRVIDQRTCFFLPFFLCGLQF